MSRLAVVSLCLLLAACSRLTPDNYAQLSAGMSRAEVEALLGKPTQCAGALGLSSGASTSARDLPALSWA